MFRLNSLKLQDSNGPTFSLFDLVFTCLLIFWDHSSLASPISHFLTPLYFFSLFVLMLSWKPSSSVHGCKINFLVFKMLLWPARTLAILSSHMGAGSSPCCSTSFQLVQILRPCTHAARSSFPLASAYSSPGSYGPLASDGRFSLSLPPSFSL